MSSPADTRLSILHPDVERYISSLVPDPDPLAGRLAQYAEANGFPLIGRNSGHWLELLTRSIGGKRVFEFGSGFGFSAYYFARAVGASGEVIGSDFGAGWIEAHRQLFQDHPLGERIRIEHGDAFEVFEATEGLFDVVLIDIDKHGYPDAFSAAVERVRPGGLILADNVLWGGKTTREAEPGDESTRALRAFNTMIFSDVRVLSAILPVGDGLSVSTRLG